MNYIEDITDLIGNTPLLKLKKINTVPDVNLFGKCEFMNPCSSVKDRIGKALIEQAEKDGLINKDTLIVEPTSGNTGIALAFIAAVKGYSIILTMPDSMSTERQRLLKALGANLELTPGHLGMQGAINRAKEIKAEKKNVFIPQQFENGANPAIHEATTGVEIYDALDGNVDILVSGVGTGGSISGISKYIKSKNPNFKTIAVEPKDSAVISGEQPGPHMIQGIGAGFIPNNLNVDIIDEVFKVSNEDAIATSRKLAKTEGLLVGISAGANVYASIEVAKRPENKGKNIVTILCDFGERYLSTILYNN